MAEHSPELRDTMRTYQQLQRRFEAAGGYAYRSRLSGVVEGLGLPDEMLERRPALALGRRAHARHAGPRPTRRRRPVAPRRAHQPPRHRFGRVARRVSRRLSHAPFCWSPTIAACWRRSADACSRCGTRARRGSGRRFRYLPARERCQGRPDAPRIRAGTLKKYRRIAAFRRPVSCEERQSQAGQSQTADRSSASSAASESPPGRPGASSWACRSLSPRHVWCSTKMRGPQRWRRRRPGRRAHSGTRCGPYAGTR